MQNLSFNKITLWPGFLAPIIYFGIQPIAAAFYPGYSFLSQVVSELGSDHARYPWILNTAVILTGLAMFCAFLGLLTGLPKMGVPKLLAAVIAILPALTGVMTIKAGIYPLPDPRHSSWGFLGFALLLFPVLFLLATWKMPETKSIKIYFSLTLAAILALVPIVSGAARLDTSELHGLVQRLFALATFPPLSVATLFVIRRLGRDLDHDRPHPPHHHPDDRRHM